MIILMILGVFVCSVLIFYGIGSDNVKTAFIGVALLIIICFAFAIYCKLNEIAAALN
jgi:hypothetical protein